MARRLVHLPGAEIGLDRALPAAARGGPQRPRDAGGGLAPPLHPGGERRLGHAALAADLDPPERGGVRVVGQRGGVLVARVDPQLAAGARCTVAACPQWSTWACVQTSRRTSSSSSPTCSSARSSLRSEPGSCMPQSTSTIPSPAASAHALQCGHAGQRQRQPQPPQARQDPLAAAHVRPSRRACARPGHANVPRMAADARAVAETYFAALRERDLDGIARMLGAGRGRQARRPGHADRPGRASGRSSPSCSPRCRTSRSTVEVTLVEGDRAAVRWRASGTFAGAALQGIAPTGARIDVEGMRRDQGPRRPDRAPTTPTPTG